MTKNELMAVGVVGLGYVGLPLAVAFGRIYPTVGFDIAADRIDLLRKGIDYTGDVGTGSLRSATQLEFSNTPDSLTKCDVIVIAVPTPVDVAHTPDFGPLISASAIVGRNMKRGVTVIFESTVYPGATEEVCIPVLEKASGLTWREDFHVGYSPERINPGDKEHTLENVIKVVAGDSAETLEKTASLYEKVVKVGVHRASSIKVAEAAKVIENTQRDLNIALMNELAVIFDRVGIDTLEVLEAAGTKWNFLKFRPGLVGGHCIGVDPYYLTHKAEMVGYHPQVILAGRRINDSMGKFVAEKVIKGMIKSGVSVPGSRVAVLGLTFKENCPDLRNSRVPDIIGELCSYGVEVVIHDPLADKDEARSEYGVDLVRWESLGTVDAVVIAVAHDDYRRLDSGGLSGLVKDGACIFDVKGALDRVEVADRYSYWRL